MASAEVERPISPKSDIPPDLKSPDEESNISREDSTLSKKANSTGQTDEPPNSSWRAGIANFWRQSKASAGGSESQQDADASGDEVEDPTDEEDPNLPITERATRRASEAPDYPVELPASPVSAPGISQSFFDTDSDSDDGAVSPTIPVITRASSVRVQRPVLVQHRSADSTRLLHRLMGSEVRLAQPSMAKAEQILGHDLSSIGYDMSGPAFKHPIPIKQTIIDNHDRSRDILQATPESHQAEFDTVYPPGVSKPGQSEAQNLPKDSNIASAPIPTSTSLSFTPSSIIEVPSTPLRREALDTLPSPMGGFGILRAPFMHSGRLENLNIDGLRSNPLSGDDISSVHRLHRTLSAPPLQTKRVKDLRRKVTIRPLDITGANQLNNGNHNLFRENVVSTPYPSRATSLDEPHIAGGLQSARLANSVLADVAEKPEQSPKAPVRDRFPSIVTNEVLKIRLSLARHPLDALCVEIPVEDRGTFDDEQLFRQVRTGYCKMIGIHGQLLPRNISFVTCSSLQGIQGFSPRDFISHFKRPKIGHKRKKWLLWLRGTQPNQYTDSQTQQNRPAASRVPGSSESQICDFTLQTTPKTAMTVLNTSGEPRNTPTIKTEPVAEGTFLTSPSTLASLEHTKKSTRTVNTHGGDSEDNEASQTLADVEEVAPNPSDLPLLTFHHAHSVPLLFLALTLTLILSALATIFWILFGVPGKSAASGNNHGGRRQMGWRWQEDAQRRVLVGFVFGILVLLGGVVLNGFWLLLGEIML